MENTPFRPNLCFSLYTLDFVLTVKAFKRSNYVTKWKSDVMIMLTLDENGICRAFLFWISFDRRFLIPRTSSSHRMKLKILQVTNSTLNHVIKILRKLCYYFWVNQPWTSWSSVFDWVCSNSGSHNRVLSVVLHFMKSEKIVIFSSFLVFYFCRSLLRGGRTKK